MKYLLIAFALFLFAGLAGPTLQELIKQSDDSFDKFDDRSALQILTEANKDFPNNAEVLWRLSRVTTHLADHLPAATDDEKDAQMKEYQKAYDLANQAVSDDPKNAKAFTYRAVANGKIALFKGVFSVAPVVKQVRDDCEHAIELDPDYSIPYYILGRTHAKLAEKPKMFRWPLGLSWGNIDDAIKYYQKAISIDGTFIMFRLDLARAYDQDDDYQKAKEQLMMIPSLPKRDEDDDSLRTVAADLLQQIKDK